MFEDSGDMTTQALAWSSSAAARMVRNARTLDGLFAYFVLIACKVRSASTLEAGLRASIETPVSRPRVPSGHPLSELIITAGTRRNPLRMPLWIVCTIEPIVLALLWVGKPTMMSTSPTLISWRRKSSVRKLSSANFFSVRFAACSGVDARQCDIVFTIYIRLHSAQPKPVKLVGPHG